MCEKDNAKQVNAGRSGHLHCLAISLGLLGVPRVSKAAKHLLLQQVQLCHSVVSLWWSVCAVAPEAVWQVGRPPYQSKIWYGGAIPIRDAGISLVLIPKTRYSITSFILLLYQLLLLSDILIQHTYLLTDLGLKEC